ncbi:MAG: DUF3703 domain-containing protein [Myxococcales bacterium]|nr:DUF3703 domain-containing protein [Myxococcales bacterium]
MKYAKDILVPHVLRELESAADARLRGDLEAAWHCLERAHILSQPMAWAHTRVHLAMLALALRTGDLRELFGQVVRLSVAAVGSAVGRFPAGNTGRARVPIAEPMSIPADLMRILDEAGANVRNVTVWRRD